jgi:hypothetical protein
VYLGFVVLFAPVEVALKLSQKFAGVMVEAGDVVGRLSPDQAGRFALGS